MVLNSILEAHAASSIFSACINLLSLLPWSNQENVKKEYFKIDIMLLFTNPNGLSHLGKSNVEMSCVRILVLEV